MDLSLSGDQVAILEAVEALARRHAFPALHDAPMALVSPELDRELAEAGFFDVGRDPDLGAVTAALLVERLARLPYAVEAASSALLLPLLEDSAARPLCMVESRRPRRPIRFLAPGSTVIVVGDDWVGSFRATEDQVTPEASSLFAYPVSTLRVDMDAVASPIVGLSPEAVRTRWRVGLAAETAGLLAAAIDATVAHVSERHQFGRPLASFQAVRHRLAEAQVRANAVRWLALKAAATLYSGDAAIAALQAQEAAAAVSYDCHQFLGAMGMTLEHPLHLWTYRLKLLTSDLGGRGEQALAAATSLWG